MGDWLLGILICVIIVIVVNQISIPANRGITNEDYKKMKREWEEEDLEEQRFKDYIEGEADIKHEEAIQKEKRRKTIERFSNRDNSTSTTNEDDLPF